MKVDNVTIDDFKTVAVDVATVKAVAVEVHTVELSAGQPEVVGGGSVEVDTSKVDNAETGTVELDNFKAALKVPVPLRETFIVLKETTVLPREAVATAGVLEVTFG